MRGHLPANQRHILILDSYCPLAKIPKLLQCERSLSSGSIYKVIYSRYKNLTFSSFFPQRTFLFLTTVHSGLCNLPYFITCSFRKEWHFIHFINPYCLELDTVGHLCSPKNFNRVPLERMPGVLPYPPA